MHGHYLVKIGHRRVFGISFHVKKVEIRHNRLKGVFGISLHVKKVEILYRRRWVVFGISFHVK
jgi:hypothetical protein